ncbi:hypothetical protein M9H77_02593 [Catharanthus roseus]|uniref:Uncharacterized protein n=1 Tax=Catharanthus roseus TaxID=4058 RepID=A0ACC0C8W8_CATRO|nr:hypothetical protein M9H77_02593 [Catharanthus roseus]
MACSGYSSGGYSGGGVLQLGPLGAGRLLLSCWEDAVGITCMCLRGSVDCARPLVTVAKWRPNIWPSKEEIATPAYGHKAQDCASSIDQTTAASGLESLPPQPPVRPTVAQTPETSFEPWMLVPSGRRHHRPLAGSDVGTERKAVRSQVPRDGITGDLIS